ncbi:MAG: hypothetical protein Q9161_006475 [Pseudevernia consocians]
MFAIISRFLFIVSSTVATHSQLVAPNVVNASSLDKTVAFTSNGWSIFQCFAPPLPPPGPFNPIRYLECTDAADKMMANVRADVPFTFSRSDNADVQLPWRARSGNCVMTMDVLNEDDEDIMCIQEPHGIAVALCRVCVSGYYRYGGRTPVGPRGVVYISVYGTTPITVEAAGPAAPQQSQVVARQIKPGAPGLLNTSSLTTTGIPVLNISNADEGECFSDSGPSPRSHLYPVKSLDCINAADEILKNRRAHVSMVFSRRATGAGLDFKLPWTARNRSCVVTVDTLNDADFDRILLFKVYQTAMNRIAECTTGGNRFGGRKAVGSKNVVYVYVFGIGSPLQTPALALSAPTHVVVARARINNIERNPPNTSRSQTTEPLNRTSTTPTANPSPLRGRVECFDPPLPRERSVPISKFADCEAATKEIVGSRTRSQIYIFSRRPSSDPDRYPLPATFRSGTCAVHLDMESEDAEDAVRLGYVESTAWVLAHKCSGLEEPEKKWGGTMTVAVGAKDLIRVWVYGVVPPPPPTLSGGTFAVIVA